MSSSKFGRLYQLRVSGNDNQIHIITYPLTCEFRITRDIQQSCQEATFLIYNLNATTRNAINKDFFDFDLTRSVTFLAGYSNSTSLSVVFTGTITTCLSYRDEGRTEWITEIRTSDAGFTIRNAISTIPSPGNTSVNFNGPVTQNQIISQLVNDLVKQSQQTADSNQLGYTLQPLKIGHISQSYTKVFSKYAYSGSTWQELVLQTNGQCFVDLSVINVLATGDAFLGEVQTIDQTSGLLSPPKRYNTCYALELLFEPRLKVGQTIKINDQSANYTPNNTNQTSPNGTYQILGLDHEGIISGSVNGKCKTHVFYISGFQGLFNYINSINPTTYV